MNYIDAHWTEQLLRERAQVRFKGYLDRLADEEYEAAANGHEKRANYLRYLQEEAPRMAYEAAHRVALRRAAA